MEGSKNAMYEQAGRVRGWTVNNSGETLKSRPIAPAREAEPVSEPVLESVAEIKAVVIPPPPVVVLPEIPMPREEHTAPKPVCETPVMAYVAAQEWRELYEPEQGFNRGTIFTELDLPFVGEGACRYE